MINLLRAHASRLEWWQSAAGQEAVNGATFRPWGGPSRWVPGSVYFGVLLVPWDVYRLWRPRALSACVVLARFGRGQRVEAWEGYLVGKKEVQWHLACPKAVALPSVEVP